MKQKISLLILGLAMSIGYTQAQEITNVRQDGDKLILDYELPKKASSVKFYYKYQSQKDSNLIGEANKLSAGSGSYVWDLSKTNTELTGENISFSIDTYTEPISCSKYIMAYGFANVGLRAGFLFNNHGFYIAPGISFDGLFGGTAGYTGRDENIGWYAGFGISQGAYNGYYGYYYDVYTEMMIEASAIYFFNNKMIASLGLSWGSWNGILPQIGVGYLF